MAVARRGAPQRLDHGGVSRGARKQVVAANDVRDPHRHVVDGDREQEHRRTVRANQDEVVQRARRKMHVALHEVLNGRVALWHGEPDRERAPLSFERASLGIGQGAAPAVVTGSSAVLRGGDLAFLELFCRAVATVSPPLGDQALDGISVDAPSLGLSVRPGGSADVGTLVPIKPEPSKRAHHAVIGLLAHAARVGVLDPQHERAAVMTGVEPAEQRRSRVAHMYRTARSGGEPTSDGRGPAHETTEFASEPTPSTSTWTRSPAAAFPTPSGVPVRRTSPGRSVMKAVMYSISVATP